MLLISGALSLGRMYLSYESLELRIPLIDGLIFNLNPTHPLLAALIIGGGFVVLKLLANLIKGNLGSDFLAGVAIILSLFLGEYLAGAIIVLMLTGGEALEEIAFKRASEALTSLAARMPVLAHRATESGPVDVPVAEVKVGDQIIVLPHELCPVDGEIVAGHGTMDEAFLTGEPYVIAKAPGSRVMSGARNGEYALTVGTTREAKDSRYAQIMRVMEQSAQQRPRIRRLADRLGAWYTPLALVVGVSAWLISGDVGRLLAVMVIATPCPLLIGIPVAIIGAVSLAARRGIVVRNPAALEEIAICSAAIFDKTGTLTSGQPDVTEILIRDDFCEALRKDEDSSAHAKPKSAKSFSQSQVLELAASLSQYSKHPLSQAIMREALRRGTPINPVDEVHEPPGSGIFGKIHGEAVALTGRTRFLIEDPKQEDLLPPHVAGLETIVIKDGKYLATIRFRDLPRGESSQFLQHLHGSHKISRVVLLSGDRRGEVETVAKSLGISEILAEKQPEEKLEFVREVTAKQRTLYVGDGINDAPSLIAATVGVALGQQHDILVESADAVVLENSLKKVDELIHIGGHMRKVALQSALGGMGMSVMGMIAGAFGFLTPIQGALIQEGIDLFAVLNALRAAKAPQKLSDF